MKLQRYNIALLPSDHTLQTTMVHISRLYFLEDQDEYILGPEGLPHITLCQFKAATLENAVTAYNDFLSNESISTIKVIIEKFNIRPGKLVNTGKFIAEYKIQPHPDLIALQLRCAKKLAAHHLENLTPSEAYSPHITLARLPVMTNKLPTKQDLNCPLYIDAHLSLGLSTEAGVFVKELSAHTL
ncbi:MAG TPA: hypothetical protein PK513_00670 [Alphaproteobacteria bacterium]|nr:hypothetical protein [Alphaproteobacteria bacterium]USO05230.1 MAG: hypothetical protein H6859_08750 [Rhodospirillales bacterium]HOO81001.1 hypothetical protein [Alphaproteobacteria bacterium]